MECPRRLNALPHELTFGRTVATDFYDGPTAWFAECASCHQVYSFRMLDWDSSQDLRIFVLSRVDVPLDVITKRLMRDAKTEKFLLVPHYQIFCQRRQSRSSHLIRFFDLRTQWCPAHSRCTTPAF